MKYTATILIEQKPEIIWNILTDGPSYPEWEPYCDKIEGTIALGNKIKAFSKLSPGRAFPVKVAEFTPHTKMAWLGGMPFGLFKGVRTFVLSPKNGAIEFTLTEEFSGPLLGLFKKTIPDMSQAFAEFAQGLKKRAEAAK